MTHFRRFYNRVWVFIQYRLDYSVAEFRGISGLLLLALLTPVIRHVYFTRPLSLVERESTELLYQQVKTVEKPVLEPVRLFMPDTISTEILKKWGFPERLATNWIKYRDKAGTFKSSAQIRSLYGMTDELFQSIRDSMIFEVSVSEMTTGISRKKNDYSQRASKEGGQTTAVKANAGCPPPMDLNYADTTMLARLHGIGPVLSSRIKRYGELLGGFVDVNQLKEVYGISEETWNHISSKVYIDPQFTPTRFLLESVTYAALYAHPYISSRQATAIIRFREHHQEIISFYQIVLMDSVTIKKINPYVIYSERIIE